MESRHLLWIPPRHNYPKDSSGGTAFAEAGSGIWDLLLVPELGPDSVWNSAEMWRSMTEGQRDTGTQTRHDSGAVRIPGRSRSSSRPRPASAAASRELKAVSIKFGSDAGDAPRTWIRNSDAPKSPSSERVPSAGSRRLRLLVRLRLRCISVKLIHVTHLHPR